MKGEKYVWGFVLYVALLLITVAAMNVCEIHKEYIKLGDLSNFKHINGAEEEIYYKVNVDFRVVAKTKEELMKKIEEELERSDVEVTVVREGSFQEKVIAELQLVRFLAIFQVLEDLGLEVYAITF